MGPVESSSLRNEGKSEAETSGPNSPAGEVIWNSMTQRSGILQADQNSLIMLSLDLPTPTHFTEIRKDRRRWAALAEAPTSGLQSARRGLFNPPGTCRKSSTKRMYFWAWGGSSSKLRAASVLQHQPGSVSYSTDTRVRTSMLAVTEAR